ncbi:aldo/keto reductase [Streptomyces sp. NBC_00986]|uniref:aldo/keto reductase n=1 Tax=Streptomyces sp. NBC_00986 TaxID=2903702 RepID=UPI00386604BA|nr:aldo/keto reductase [Streptomyces sp. NBC_00986]
MRLRRFGRTGWQVGEIGYGMWGIGGGTGGWTGGDEGSGREALRLAVDQGCTFFDTAWIYGRGHSELLLGELRAEYPDGAIRIATKIPPLDRNWPTRPGARFTEVFPDAHVAEYLALSLKNLGAQRIDLMQYHVWDDSWADDDEWLAQAARMKERGLVEAVGISVNRWEPTNVLAALETGLVDAVQVIYNIFDQAPEDELFAACARHDVAVIARVPFDEGTLTGSLTTDTRWPEGDWRNSYFVPANLAASVERADRLRPVVPEGMTMPQLALRFILQHPAVSTVIPGMRTPAHVRANLSVSDGVALPAGLMDELRRHRWDRVPTEWSQ